MHRMRPELESLTRSKENLMGQVVYAGLRADKPTSELRREVPHPKR